MQKQHYSLEITDRAQHLRSRYLSDLRKGSHGVLKGINSDYPSVQLKVNSQDQNKQFYILCELYNKPASNNGVKCVSPNVIVHKSIIKNKNKQNDEMINYQMVLEPMIFHMEDNTFKYILKDYVIVKTKRKNDANEVLNLKRKFLHSMDNLHDCFPIIADEIINNIDEIYLGYTAFEKINETFIYEDGPIFNKIPPKYQIVQNCNAFGSYEGGYVVTLLVHGITKKPNFKVQIFEINEDNTVGWHVDISKEKIKVFKNCALTFEMPKYHNADIATANNDYKKCYIKLIVGNDESNAVPFEYNLGLLPLAKRKKASRKDYLCTDSHKQITNDFALVKQKINDALSRDFRRISLREFKDINKDFVKQHPLGNTVLHEFIAVDEFLEFSESLITKLPQSKVIFEEARNRRKENLLHYACKLNKANCIHKLINLNCSLLEQSTNDSTPMHIAVKNNYAACIDKFIELIDNNATEQTEESRSLIKDMKRLLELYNHQNYTILHLAVLNNCYALVERLLQFAELHHVDLCAIKVRTNGNNIWHLAVENNLTQMQELIKRYLPNIHTYDNYAGDYSSEDEPNETPDI